MKRMIVTLCAAMSFSVFSAPAAAEPGDPAMAAAIHGLIEASNIRTLLQSNFEQMRENPRWMLMTSVLSAVMNKPKLTRKQQRQALARTQDRLSRGEVPEVNAVFNDPKLVDDVVVEFAVLYEQRFTVSEINDIAAFYRTDAGQKLLANAPAIMNEAAVISQRVIMTRLDAAVAASIRDL